MLRSIHELFGQDFEQGVAEEAAAVLGVSDGAMASVRLVWGEERDA
jgi:hypothetical protein